MLQNSLLSQLPHEFQQFLQNEGIDPSIFVECASRYIRLKPKNSFTLSQLQELISIDIKPVDWIVDMYEIANSVKISNNELYKSGQMYGIDLSSAAVVLALDINQSDFKVLEVCCAPGAKLTYIADLMSQFPGERKLYGVDINANRLNIAMALLQKYNLDKFVKCVLADGTTYQGEKEFDKILVDAECTHEGSIKHLQKYTMIKTQPQKNKSKKSQKQSRKQLEKNHITQQTTLQERSHQWSQQDFMDRFLDPLKLQNLTTLQYNLLSNASTLLKIGGILVYSTCSFTKRQNEDIIEEFLTQNKNFQLEDPFLHNSTIPCRPGSLEKTVRFDPMTSKCGGMFVAKLRKF